MAAEIHEGLETLRAVAILAVVQLHCLRPYFVAAQDRRPMEDAYRCLLDLATPSFFFISGYLTTRRPAALQRRLTRVLLPLFVVSGLKHSVSFCVASVKQRFWNNLIFGMSLRHLGPHPFSPACVLHDKLIEYDGGKPEDPPAISQFLFEAATGTSFGFLYFPVALGFLHVIDAFALSKLNSSSLYRLSIVLTILHPFRTLLKLPAQVAWRLPFHWIAYYVNGKAAASGLSSYNARAKKAFFFVASLCALFIAAGLASVEASQYLIVFFKELWSITFPLAVVFKQHLSIGRPIRILRDELARFSYFIYLYHGFFLFAGDFVVVFGATCALAYSLEFLLKPDVATKAFGMSKRRKMSATTPSEYSSERPSSSLGAATAGETGTEKQHENP